MMHLSFYLAHLNLLLQLGGDVLACQSQLLLQPPFILLDDPLNHLRFVIKVQLVLIDDDQRGIRESLFGTLFRAGRSGRFGCRLG